MLVIIDGVIVEIILFKKIRFILTAYNYSLFMNILL